ncbi:hypothetical protein CRYUN_Cryun23aG0139600 [Craigia yunnanensis]
MEDFRPSAPSLTRMVPQKVDSGGPYRLLQCSSKGDKAACEGWIEVVVLLLEKGADVNSLDRWGRTPWSDARSFGHHEICKILEARRGIDPVGVNSQAPCFEIDPNEVDMDEATLSGEVSSILFNFFEHIFKSNISLIFLVLFHPYLSYLVYHGAYGEVYLVKWRGSEVAAKTIRSSIASNPKAKLRHPNIMQFLGVLRSSDCLIFLTEYLRNGILYDILKKKGRLDPRTAIAYALDIARGMNYLHQHKPHDTPRFDAKEKDSYGYKMTGGTGSYRYMAPEVYCRESYGKSIDVFSFALIVHEMFHGGPSNRGQTAEQVADKRAYEDLRPPLFSYIYPEPIKV